MEYNIESTIKSIFLGCIKEPQIIDALKNELSEDDKSCESVSSINNELHDHSITETDLVHINHKLDKLLKGQDNIMSFFESSGNQGNDKIERFIGFKKNQNDDIMSWKQDKEKLEEQINMLKRDLKQKQDILDKFQDAEEFLKVWRNIEMLSDDSKDYIAQLCGSNAFYAIVSLGRDEGKIGQLWNYLRDQAVKRNVNEKDVEIINTFFEFCIKVANSIKTKGDRYSFYEPTINDEYDMENCIKTSNSKQVGYIKEIIVRGVKQNEKIRFKSIVQIG